MCIQWMNPLQRGLLEVMLTLRLPHRIVATDKSAEESAQSKIFCIPPTGARKGRAFELRCFRTALTAIP